MSLSRQAASGFGEAFSLLARRLDCKTEVLALVPYSHEKQGKPTSSSPKMAGGQLCTLDPSRLRCLRCSVAGRPFYTPNLSSITLLRLPS